MRARRRAQVESLLVGSAFLFVVVILMAANGDRTGTVWVGSVGASMAVLALTRGRA